MSKFGTFHDSVRVPGRSLDPVIDPAAWEPDELDASDDWIYRLTAGDLEDLTAAMDHVERKGIDMVDMVREDFPLPRLGAALREVRLELMEGRGLAVLRGLPVAEMGRERAALAYFGIGTHLGVPISQNAYGHLLGHVRDFGKNFDDPNVRGYQSSAARWKSPRSS